MWKYASELVPGLEYLNEPCDGRSVGDKEVQRFKLTDQEYEACLTRINVQLNTHPALRKKLSLIHI